MGSGFPVRSVRLKFGKEQRKETARLSKATRQEAGVSLSKAHCLTSRSASTKGVVTAAGESLAHFRNDPSICRYIGGRETDCTLEEAGIVGRSTSPRGGHLPAGDLRQHHVDAAHGGIRQAALGSGVTEAPAYTARLQPASIQAGARMILQYTDSNTRNN